MKTSVSIKKGFYNPAILQKDGITQKVDTSISYPYYEININKIAFTDNQEEAINELIGDLYEELQKVESRKR